MRRTAYAIIASLLGLTSCGSETNEQAFWKWFQKNQADLYDFEKDREAIFDRLSAEMQKVNDALTFEFGPVSDDATREFVISAGGVQSAFPSVEALYAAAPKLPKWKILKFRQRKSPISDIGFAERTVKSDDVHYAIFEDEDPQKLGIMIFLEDYVEEERDEVWAHFGYLFLDEALGEYDVETHVGGIVFSDKSSKYFSNARPLAELSADFDKRLGRIKEK